MAALLVLSSLVDSHLLLAALLVFLLILLLGVLVGKYGLVLLGLLRSFLYGLCGSLSDVEHVVAQTLKLGHKFIVLVQNRHVVLQLQVGQQFHGVPAQVVRHAVDFVLLL